MGEQLELFPGQTPPKSEPNYINHPEWCFQFFDNEPVPFAYAKMEGIRDPLVLEVKPIENEALIFQYKGMSFKIFARELSEEGKNELKSESKN